MAGWQCFDVQTPVPEGGFIVETFVVGLADTFAAAKVLKRHLGEPVVSDAIITLAAVPPEHAMSLLDLKPGDLRRLRSFGFNL